MDMQAHDRLTGDPARSTVTRTGRGLLGGSPPTTATGLVLREITSLALVTQAVWILASPDLWPTRLAPPIAGAAVAVSVAAWGVLLVLQFRGTATHRRYARYADVAAVAVAVVVCEVTAGDSGSGEQAWSLAVLCAGLIGALVELRVAVVLVATLALFTLEPILRYGSPEPGAGAGAPAVAAYVVIIGGCIIGVRGVLERNARRIDDDAARRDEIERQQRLVEGVESAMRRQERLLHETVLNTLTAIHRGGLGSASAMGTALEERCLEAIDVLSDLESGAQSLEPVMTVTPLGYVTLNVELAAFIDGLRADGLRVDVVVDSLEDVPQQVRTAVLTAMREALANVARHAQAHHARVLVRVQRAGDSATRSAALSVRAEVRDDGVGFDPRRAPRGFGLNRAIVGPMLEVGGTARVESRPGSGTRVILEWRSTSTEGLPGRGSRAPGFVLPAAATFGLFLAATAILAWLQFDHPPVTVTDVALVAVLGVLISMGAPEAPLSWALIATISALGPLFALLQASAGESQDPAFGGGWALSAIAALFMTAAAIGPRWAWLPLVVSWLMVEGDPAGTVLQPATIVVIGGGLMGRSLRRDSLAVERAHRERQTAQTALVVTRESLARLRARYGALEDSQAIGVLQGIVDGRLDAEDPDVRRRAGLEETFIRNLVRIDPEADRLRGLVARLSRTAHRSGVHLRADLSLPRMPAVVVGPGVEESFGRAVESTVPDDSVRLTARTEGDGVVVTLLTPILDGERDHMRALPVPGVDTDPDDPDDPVMLWEVRLASDRRP